MMSSTLGYGYVVQAHPHAELAEGVAEVVELGAQRAAAPEAGAVLGVDAVGGGVLGDHQQLLDAGVDEVLGLAHHVADRAADEIAAQGRDDAEGAAVVAAFGDLEVGVVVGRELDALGRQQVDEGVVGLGQVLVHLLHDLLGGVGPVTASTCGWAAMTTSSLAPRQPVTMTLPFSARASPMASRDSSTAASMKPQVLITTRSEPS
jgi:hypothetical protein